MTSWQTAIGIAVGLLATALLVCESLPLFRLGRERALLGGALGLAVAASIGLLVGFELADVDLYGGRTILDRFVGRDRPGRPARPRERHAARRPPRENGAIRSGSTRSSPRAAGLAFASLFMPWAVAAHGIGLPSIDGWVGPGTMAVVFGLAAVATFGAESLHLFGLRPLLPATIVLAGLTAIFGVLSLISLARQLGNDAVLGHGAWLALAACAALLVGAVLRWREFRLD